MQTHVFWLLNLNARLLANTWLLVRWIESCIKPHFMQGNLIYVHFHCYVIRLTCIAHTGSRLVTQKITHLSKTIKRVMSR